MRNQSALSPSSDNYAGFFSDTEPDLEDAGTVTWDLVIIWLLKHAL